ncbi:MAG: transcription termination/antitermination protein NusA [Armatimonadota bacterium]|nr:Transcription termination/antitermination protein NusA [Fimbriimonadaceae bacterium]GIK33287.1 MAG: transcription termination/antitermination protein NusA [Armatimonadota bacterium]
MDPGNPLGFAPKLWYTFVYNQVCLIGWSCAAFFYSRGTKWVRWQRSNMEILQQLRQIAQERDIPFDELLREIEEALAVAYKKYVGAAGEVAVHIDPERLMAPDKGMRVVVEKEVVGIVTEPSYQLSVAEARKKQPNAEVGDFVQVEVDPNRFGRIAASTFKQVLSQKLREAEIRQINEVFQEKIGDLVNGLVTRRDEHTVYIQVNKVEAELPRREQVPTESYRINDRLKVYVLKVDDSRRRLAVVVSRTHPNLLRKLFELEVPEIAQSIVQIKSVAREPGQRSKIAVISTDERVDAVGACVGPRGARVQAIVDELHDEKIDIVPFSDNPTTYIINALSPAKVNSIRLNEADRSAYVVVPDNQLSLAIGKGGQNVRLAARLTEWKIDIRSEAQAATESKAPVEEAGAGS